jgi:putative phage-type endonuclease
MNSNQPEIQSQDPEFHNIRRKGIGGSDIHIIMELSTFSTPYRLWLEKTGRVPPKDISNLPHVKRGIENEAPARALVEKKYGVKLEPKFWQDKEYEFFRCSCDGSNEEYLLEVKCMSLEAHLETERGSIPNYYWAQLQWNMAVSGVSKGIFCSYHPESNEIAVIDVPADPDFQAEARYVAKNWWEKYVIGDTPPPMGAKDYVHVENAELESLSNEWLKTVQEIKSLEANKKSLEAKISQYLMDFAPNGGGIRGTQLTVSRQIRKGSIDYSKIDVLKESDLEAYRKPSTEFVVIRQIKKDSLSEALSEL